MSLKNISGIIENEISNCVKDEISLTVGVENWQIPQISFRIPVEYMNRNGIISTNSQDQDITMAALIKHFGVAGMGFAPTTKKLRKIFSSFLYFCPYLNPDFLNKGKFSQPNPKWADPTEKGHFSNIAGKAIADFLAKRIDNCSFTVTYEAAMRKAGL